ncbi:MAG: FecR domain-containing protein [Gemmataceae bacterium]|nr:FecR domain-containing protein [Gemmataceae bacterium]
MTFSDRYAELFALTEALCLDELTSEQKMRLECLVASDDALRQAYVRYLHMHVCLRRAFEQDGKETTPTGPTTPLAPAAPAAHPHSWVSKLRRSRGSFVLLAASVLLAAGLWAFLGLPDRHGDHAPLPQVATLTNAIGCVWDAANPPSAGTPLHAGKLALSAGVAEITFANGAIVLVEAPASLDLVSDSRGFLHSGRIVARVPERAKGFIIETAKANLVDHGTEFGVGVGSSGDTLVEVFEGVVVADWKHSGASQRLTAGQTVQLDGGDGSEPRALAPAPQRFVRRMPDPKTRGADWLAPYNRVRYDSVHIVPAPGPVMIDGDLKDWDRSGRFFIACQPPYVKDYHVEGAMMYDDQFLYIGAHVGDPAAMSSIIDPKTDPSVGWKGGAVQVRLCTDRGLGWPVDAENGIIRQGRPMRPQDRSKQLVHLTMWYHLPGKQPCLHIAYGMNFHGDLINPPEARGVFRKDADGRGYTLEYAVPWSLLTAGQKPPEGGETMGACWNVHWSDENGRLWRGYLVDILNPNEKGFTYLRAQTWGRAVYHKTGNLAPGMIVPRD